jgi:hypothetical protein
MSEAQKLRWPAVFGGYGCCFGSGGSLVRIRPPRSKPIDNLDRMARGGVNILGSILGRTLSDSACLGRSLLPARHSCTAVPFG